MHEGCWPEISQRIAQLLGLHFPHERLQELRRGVGRAAQETGIPEHEFAGRILARQLTQGELDVLASHLTVGETYFFRDPDLIGALKGSVLPELLERRADTRRLRLWSAGCCTGEEAYTLAMLLSDAIPAMEQWQVSILATDVNPRFLHKAQMGVFGEWSFRATPENMRRRHFRKLPDGRYAIDERLRSMVTFAPLNLSEAVYPSVVTGTNAMDVILCRNVLMYFEHSQSRSVVTRLGAALVDGGWLSVAPCEASRTLLDGFESVGVATATLYRKTRSRAGGEIAAAQPPDPGPVVIPGTPLARKRNPARVKSPVMLPTTDTANPVAYQAKTLADQGHLEEALALCDNWGDAAPLDASAQYLKALISMEMGHLDVAAKALQRCSYLAADEPMVTFALGNLDRLRGRHRFALNAYRYVLEQLSSRDPAESLRYSDGLTVGQLKALANELVASEQLHDRAA